MGECGVSKNLKSFNGKKNVKIDNETIEEVKKNISSEDLSEVKKITAKYKDKSSNEMFDDILKMINQGKSNGNLSNSELQAFAENIMPMLSPQQVQSLKRLINSTK